MARPPGERHAAGHGADESEARVREQADATRRVWDHLNSPYVRIEVASLGGRTRGGARVSGASSGGGPAAPPPGGSGAPPGGGGGGGGSDGGGGDDGSGDPSPATVVRPAREPDVAASEASDAAAAAAATSESEASGHSSASESDVDVAPVSDSEAVPLPGGGGGYSNYSDSAAASSTAGGASGESSDRDGGIESSAAQAEAAGDSSASDSGEPAATEASDAIGGAEDRSAEPFIRGRTPAPRAWRHPYLRLLRAPRDHPSWFHLSRSAYVHGRSAARPLSDAEAQAHGVLLRAIRNELPGLDGGVGGASDAEGDRGSDEAGEDQQRPLPPPRPRLVRYWTRMMRVRAPQGAAAEKQLHAHQQQQHGTRRGIGSAQRRPHAPDDPATQPAAAAAAEEEEAPRPLTGQDVMGYALVAELQRLVYGTGLPPAAQAASSTRVRGARGGGAEPQVERYGGQWRSEDVAAAAAGASTAQTPVVPAPPTSSRPRLHEDVARALLGEHYDAYAAAELREAARIAAASTGPADRDGSIRGAAARVEVVLRDGTIVPVVEAPETDTHAPPTEAGGSQVAHSSSAPFEATVVDGSSDVTRASAGGSGSGARPATPRPDAAAPAPALDRATNPAEVEASLTSTSASAMAAADAARAVVRLPAIDGVEALLRAEGYEPELVRVPGGGGSAYAVPQRLLDDPAALERVLARLVAMAGASPLDSALAAVTQAEDATHEEGAPPPAADAAAASDGGPQDQAAVAIPVDPRKALAPLLSGIVFDLGWGRAVGHGIVPGQDSGGGRRRANRRRGSSSSSGSIGVGGIGDGLGKSPEQSLHSAVSSLDESAHAAIMAAARVASEKAMAKGASQGDAVLAAARAAREALAHHLTASKQRSDASASGLLEEEPQVGEPPQSRRVQEQAAAAAHQQRVEAAREALAVRNMKHHPVVAENAMPNSANPALQVSGVVWVHWLSEAPPVACHLSPPPPSC